MTEQDAINAARNVQEFCNQFTECYDCPFWKRGNYKSVCKVNNFPSKWDLQEAQHGEI